MCLQEADSYKRYNHLHVPLLDTRPTQAFQLLGIVCKGYQGTLQGHSLSISCYKIMSVAFISFIFSCFPFSFAFFLRETTGCKCIESKISNCCKAQSRQEWKVVF